MTMITPAAAAPRLTSLSHGGGCGCKIAPGMLADLLKGSAPAAAPFAQLLVGLESADDAAVDQLSEHQALVLAQLIHGGIVGALQTDQQLRDRKSTRLNSSHMSISYAVVCLKKKIVT